MAGHQHPRPRRPRPGEGPDRPARPRARRMAGLGARQRTAAEWEQIRIQAGSRVFVALYQGRPSPDQGNVWQRQWWRRYRDAAVVAAPRQSPAPTWCTRCDEMVMSWDMAFKDTKSSDFVVGQVWARRGADVLPARPGAQAAVASRTHSIAFTAHGARKWPQATRKLVEDKANGTAVISTLKSKIPGIVADQPDRLQVRPGHSGRPVHRGRQRVPARCGDRPVRPRGADR